MSLTFEKPKTLRRGSQYKLQEKKSVDYLTYLGVKLNRSLLFLPHLAPKRRDIFKATKNLYKFSSVSGRLPPNFFKICYLVILQRNIAYACSIWYHCIWGSH